MIQASAPGKLYITGEYAVLESGHPAIIVALDQYITVYLQEQNEQGSITSSYSNFLPIPWTRKNGQVFVDERENPFNYVLTAIQTTERYIQALHIPLKFYHLDIQSKLAKQDGRKYGLGSSGAVTVATIKALLKFYQVPYDAMLLYKLCVLTHLEIGSNGSFGDIAASTFGGWIAYRKFDAAWLKKERQHSTIEDLLQKPWKDLSIEALPAPKDLDLCIGWTGSPASTTHLVDQMNEDNEQHKKFHARFLAEAKRIVEQTIADMKAQNTATIMADILAYRQLLLTLEEHAHLCIETESLQNFCQLAQQYGAAGKSSGAGGGDCGIALIPKTEDKAALIAAWQEVGIEYLDFQVHEEKNDTTTTQK